MMQRKNSGTMPDGTPCKCASPEQLQSCIKNKKNRPANPGYVGMYANCGNWAATFADTCCMSAIFTTDGGHDLYYGPNIWKVR